MTTQDMLDQRYGRGTKRSRRFWSVFASIAIGAAVLVAAWYAFGTPSNTISATNTGYELVDEHTASVAFQVTAPAGSAFACVLEAQDTEHGIVGWKIVEYPATDEHSRAFVEEIPLTAEATTGLVNGCWLS